MYRYVYIITMVAMAALLPACGSGKAAQAEERQVLAIARYIIPHFAEGEGKVDDPGAMSTSDWSIHAVYSGGLSGTAERGGATVTVHLFGADGLPLMNAGSQVCPGGGCAFNLDASQRKVSIDLDDLITANGQVAFDRSTMTGFAMITVVGAGAGSVNITGLVQNIRTGPGDLAVFVFEPQPVSAAA